MRKIIKDLNKSCLIEFRQIPFALPFIIIAYVLILPLVLLRLV